MMGMRGPGARHRLLWRPSAEPHSSWPWGRPKRGWRDRCRFSNAGTWRGSAPAPWPRRSRFWGRLTTHGSRRSTPRSLPRTWCSRGYLAVVLEDAVSDNTPLPRTIARYVDQAVVDALEGGTSLW